MKCLLNRHAKKTNQLSRCLINFTVIFIIQMLFYPVMAESLNQLQGQYQQQLDAYNNVSRGLTHINTEIETSQARLKDLSEEKINAAAALKDIQRIDRENPGLGLASKVDEARQHNREAFASHRAEEEKLKDLRSQAIQSSSQVKKEAIELNRLADEIDFAGNQIINAALDKRISKFSQATEVEGYAEVGCGDESARKCQRRAKKSAERNASEKGSVVLVEAATNIDNFEITQDQVKTEVQAQLSNVKVLEKGWVGDESYQYRIKATVTPIISSNLREKFKLSIAQELGLIIPTKVPTSGAVVTAAPFVATTARFTPATPPPAKPAADAQGKANKFSRADKAFAELDAETGTSATERELEVEHKQARAKVVARQEPVASEPEADEIDNRRRRIYGVW